MAAGYLMITTFDIHTTNQTLVEAMILIGLGLGCTMQTYTLVVQNSVSRADLRVHAEVGDRGVPRNTSNQTPFWLRDSADQLRYNQLKLKLFPRLDPMCLFVSQAIVRMRELEFAFRFFA